MNKMLKTWPEKFYFQGANNEFSVAENYRLFYESDVTHCAEQIYEGDVEYIRSDIVKGREEAAFRKGITSFHGNEWPQE